MAKLSKLEEEEKLATINIFTWKAFKLPRVIYKKMGKHWGLFHPTRNLIEIDSRLRGKKEMEISIHELLHWALPFLNEDAIRMLSRKLTDFLWNQGYRKIDSGK